MDELQCFIAASVFLAHMESSGLIDKWLSSSHLQKLLTLAMITDTAKYKIYSKKKKRGTCSICLDKFEGSVAYLKCNHYFCEVCIRAWVNTGGTCCPLCRYEF